MIDTDRTGVTREPDANVLAVLVAWEAGVITAEQACRALGVDFAGLYDLEMATIERGKALATGKAAAKCE